MKKSKNKKKDFFDYFMVFMFISIFVPVIVGIIILMADNSTDKLTGLYVVLSGFAFMYFDFCILVLHKLFKDNRKVFVITIVVSAILIGIGLFFTLKGNDEKKEECIILDVAESKITVKFQDIELNINKPFLKKVGVGNTINVYYNGNNIDKVHFIKYSFIGNFSLVIGCIFLLFGGVFMEYIPEMINSYKDLKKIERNKL